MTLQGVRRTARRLRAWLGRRRRERDLAAELESHLQLHIDDNLRAGMTPVEARRVALVALGGVEAAREAYRDRLGWPWVDGLIRDVRFGWRSLARSPGFAAAAIVVLALGIGANTAIFGVVNAALLRPLPIRADDRVAVVWVTDPAHGRSRVGPSGQDYLDWTEHNTRFEDLFLFEHGSGTITGLGQAEQVKGLRVTTNFADFLGITPVVGRTFAPADRNRNVLLLSTAYWRARFNADPGVVGRPITLNGESYEVVGVLPTDACFWYPADVVVPWPLDRLKGADSELGVFGRLERGATFAAAQSAMNAVAARVAADRPDQRRGWGITVVPIRDVATEYIRPALFVLLGAVGFVLLIACANVANLLVARTVARSKEIAVRTALGAGRWRLAQQFLVEGLLLALAGGGLGLLMAAWGGAALRAIVPAAIPVPAAASDVPLPHGDIDNRVLVFTLLLSIAVTLACGLGPLLACVRSNPADSLRDRTRTSAPAANRSRRALVALEAALAVVLVVGSGLMIETFWRLLTVNPGFQPDRLFTVQLKLADDAASSRYRDPAARAVAIDRFLDEVHGVPGVEAASFAMILPLSQDDQDVGGFVSTERPLGVAAAAQATAEFRIVARDYFQTMRIPVIAGRALSPADENGAQRVVVIDETLARTYFAGTNPIGRHVQIPDASRPPREIVGVVGGVLDDGLDQRASPTIYIPYAQAPAQTVSLVVRSPEDAGGLLPALKRAIWRVDPDQPLFNARRMSDIVAKTISARRLAFVLLGLFAALALVLASVGIYSVTAYGVRQRRREIGVRMALGARPSDILRLVVNQGMGHVTVGLIAGIVAAGALSRALQSLLFGVPPLDVPIFAGVALGFGLVALVANGIPAWRAAGISPMEALAEQ